MNVFIVGLGLIGASYAEKLSECAHTVFGFDQNPDVVKSAIKQGVIDANSSLARMSEADVVIIALYPKDTIAFLKEHRARFKETQTLTDVCGIKETLINEVTSILPASLHYLSHHPMAGKERPGFEARDKAMFKGANCLVVPTESTRAIDAQRLNQILSDLEFGSIKIVSKERHDTLIAYTSQLTHVMASCLINTMGEDHARGAVGDSFRDLTRIARINAPLWTDLFVNNKSALLKTLKAFKEELNTFEDLLESSDNEAMEAYLDLAKKRRVAYD